MDVMDITVGIEDGRIVVRQARRGGSTPFDTDAEAVAHLSRHVAQMARRVGYDDSCKFPGMHGRPNFNLVAFKAALDREVGKFGQALGSYRAA